MELSRALRKGRPVLSSTHLETFLTLGRFAIPIPLQNDFWIGSKKSRSGSSVRMQQVRLGVSMLSTPSCSRRMLKARTSATCSGNSDCKILELHICRCKHRRLLAAMLLASRCRNSQSLRIPDGTSAALPHWVAATDSSAATAILRNNYGCYEARHTVWPCICQRPG